MSQRVQERGLAGVRVADERDFEESCRPARCTLRSLSIAPEPLAQDGDAFLDEAAVDLDLLFAHAAARGAPPRWRSKWVQKCAACGSRYCRRASATWVLDSFVRAWREKISMITPGTIEIGLADFLFEISQLIRRELDVEDHGFGAIMRDELELDLVDLALADVGGRVDLARGLPGAARDPPVHAKRREQTDSSSSK